MKIKISGIPKSERNVLYKKARRLRKKRGFTAKEISAHLNISKTTAYKWIRDIIAQEDKKFHNNYKATQGMIRKYSELRKDYRKQGIVDASNKNILHACGCMLFWAEGTKSKNFLDFTNSDPFMLKYFMKFLKRCFYVKP